MAAALAPAAASAALDGYYGANIQQVFSGPSADWQPRLSSMAGGGLELGRTDARWSAIEPNPPGSGGAHSYDWTGYDAIVQAMAQHGLRWYPIVGYSTGWAGAIPGDENSAPVRTSDFLAYTRAFAARYGRGGSFWAGHPSLPRLPVTTYEVWNEENSTVFWHPQADAAERYADLYLATRAAIKAVDPAASVVVGGLALGGDRGGTDEIAFLQRMFAHRPDLRGNVDAVGLHPYQATVGDVYMRLARFRQALDGLAGPSVPIEITELGWSSINTAEASRAAYLSTIAEQLPRSDCNVDRFLPYTWVTREQDPSDPEDWFGIFNRDGSAKPSGAAYVNAVRSMRGLAPGAPTGGPLTICHPTDAGDALVAPPRLKLKLRVVVAHHRIKLLARCPSGCRMRITLLAKRSVGARTMKPLRRWRLAHSSRVRRVTLGSVKRLRRYGRKLRVSVVATNGPMRTARARQIRPRCASRHARCSVSAPARG